MAIEIYDNAKTIKKGNHYYYFVKYGSKNCFTCPNQRVVDNNFRSEYIWRQRRDSDWSLMAHGSTEAHKNDRLADTWWNGPTSSVYGRIRFGNGKNIALYLMKNREKVTLDYDLLDDGQKSNIDNLINHYSREENKKWTIDLDKEIPEGKQYQNEVNYCGTNYAMTCNNPIMLRGKMYWNLDNL